MIAYKGLNCHITYYGENWTFYCEKAYLDTKICLILIFRKIFGGKRGIRTLGTLLTYTRVPVVRLRPAQPSFHPYSALRACGASDGT